jgi:hypothetical protein
MSPRWRLILAAAAFVAWMGWLGYAALVKSDDPIVSHAQAAAAPVAVVAEVPAGDGGPGRTATVVEAWSGENPPAGEITVSNLPRAGGFAGPGQYLLYLKPAGEAWELVGPQRSPGSDPGGAPLIYPWTPGVRAQAENLRH